MKDDIAKTVEHFASGVKAIATDLDKFLSSEERVGLTLAAERLSQNNVPKDLAKRLVSFEPLYSALDIVEIAVETKRERRGSGGCVFCRRRQTQSLLAAQANRRLACGFPLADARQNGTPRGCLRACKQSLPAWF